MAIVNGIAVVVAVVVIFAVVVVVIVIVLVAAAAAAANVIVGVVAPAVGVVVVVVRGPPSTRSLNSLDSLPHYPWPGGMREAIKSGHRELGARVGAVWWVVGLLLTKPYLYQSS